MRDVGFSTGAVADGGILGAIGALRRVNTRVIELSALRWEELDHLQRIFESLELKQFRSVSVHLPSKFVTTDETTVLNAAHYFVRHGARVVVHPDTITRFDEWAKLGAALLIENMDKRKPHGRTTSELRDLFQRLPQALLCLDLGHARQVDPSLVEMFNIIKTFFDRIGLLHVSDVSSSSRHERLSTAGKRILKRVADSLPADVSAVIEAPVQPEEIEAELNTVNHALSA